MRAIFALLIFALFSIPAISQDEPKQWQVYDGYAPDGYGRHLVFVSGDEEYRSEEALSQLAKIMAVRHGFKCTVLYAQDPEKPGFVNPQVLNHIPGLEALETADLMVIATRFRALPDDQMDKIEAYLMSGRPVVGLRTANHGFRFPEDSKWHHWSWKYEGEKKAWHQGFGGLVLGSWFFSHHGWHGKESTRGIPEKGARKHEILRGIEPESVWGATDVYGVKEPIPGDDVQILLRGQVLTGMEMDSEPLGPGPYEKAPDYIREGSNDKNKPMQALAWTKSYQIPNGRKGRVFSTTLGASQDLAAEGTRRLLANGIFWCLGMAVPQETNVEIVDEFEPSPFKTHKREYWEERKLKVSDFDLKTPFYPENTGWKTRAAELAETGYEFATHPVNQYRPYNWYADQAASFLRSNEELPSLLPHFPDLDGGIQGHWGVFHKNSYKDRRYNLAERGSTASGIFRAGKMTLPRAIAVSLAPDFHCAFDPVTMRYTHIWKGDFLNFPSNRWGIGGGFSPGGKIIYENPSKFGWFLPELEKEKPDVQFLGHFKIGEKTIFRFVVEGHEVWSSPSAKKNGDGNWEFVQEIEYSRVVPDVTFASANPGGMFVGPKLRELALAGGEPRYADKSITLAGKVGQPIPNSPFAIDRIPVPLHNDFGSVMLLSGLDFFENGDAAVCTMMGDVWRVSGLDAELKNVTWTRIAKGLNQALGLSIHGDTIYVIGRDRISRLHDLNGDGEIDFYENFCDDFPASTGGHDFYVGLQRDSNGYFYFVAANSGVVKVAPDGSSAEIIADGLRNTNGIGVRVDGLVVTSTNEGDWTPASAIMEVRDGDFYGRGAKKDGEPIAPAMAYIPRGIDNSSGGQIFCTSEIWGPLKDQLLHFSFGNGLWMMCLRDEKDGARTQGAIVPFPGDFESGAHRGRFNPKDGQLYVVGADGWGNYAITDGSFARVRFNPDAEFTYPTGWKAHKNGIRLNFATAIDPESVKPENFLCQQWNYQYGPHYGSLEFSLKARETPGHDPVTVKSAHVLDGGKSVFLEMPSLTPSMQFHIYGEAKTASGADFKVNLFPTLLRLDDDFSKFDGYSASSPDKVTKLDLPVRWPVPFKPKVPNGKPGSLRHIEAISGLRFSEKEIHAKPGERITIRFKNKDSIPHNFVLCKPGTFQTVGQASNEMLSNPKIAELHYVPETDDVLHFTPMLYTNQQHELHIAAPTEPGTYPYICTFPGHWAVMKG
ncbi:MAG: hypothetical protein HKN23_11210, partial [Verrucomicrobiales bacterium]|nr:hypothetical protein [Verrucomicrobiales bacterium]